MEVCRTTRCGKLANRVADLDGGGKRNCLPHGILGGRLMPAIAKNLCHLFGQIPEFVN